MQLYLAGIASTGVERYLEFVNPPYILESALSISSEMLSHLKLGRHQGFMLDSGAFTFSTSRKGDSVDWDEYVRNYAKLIRAHAVRRFFELDIDSVVGYSRVLELRELLEELVGAPCIPVWHRSRGKQAFLDMVRDYDYVAIGGIAAREILPGEVPALRPFVAQAHRSGARIHGLGLTYDDPQRLVRLGFDSVDSTSWVSSRWGAVPTFKNGRIVTVRRPEGCALKLKGQSYEVNGRALAEWSKYARHLDRLGQPDLPRGGRALGSKAEPQKIGV